MVDMIGRQISVSNNPWETSPSSLTYDHVGYPTSQTFPYGQSQVPSCLLVSPTSTESTLSFDSVADGHTLDDTPRAPAHRPKRGGLSQGFMARQEVLQQYEIAKTDRISRERSCVVRRVHGIKNVAFGLGNEKQAESSRAKKLPTPDDIRDPESISGMKYQLHWDRERIARDKALRLLNGAYGNINVL